MSDRPILYLDVDDTLVSYHAEVHGGRRVAPGRVIASPDDVGSPPTDVLRVLTEANELCEIRWLTWWAPSGRMLPHQIDRLARILGVPHALLEGHDNPLQCLPHKTNGIDWEAHCEGRQWFWLEDWCDPTNELPVLLKAGAADRYYKAHTTDSPDSLATAWDAIKDRIHRLPTRAAA